MFFLLPKSDFSVMRVSELLGGGKMKKAGLITSACVISFMTIALGVKPIKGVYAEENSSFLRTETNNATSIVRSVAQNPEFKITTANKKTYIETTNVTSAFWSRVLAPDNALEPGKYEVTKNNGDGWYIVATKAGNRWIKPGYAVATKTTDPNVFMVNGKKAVYVSEQKDVFTYQDKPSNGKVGKGYHTWVKNGDNNWYVIKAAGINKWVKAQPDVVLPPDLAKDPNVFVKNGKTFVKLKGKTSLYYYRTMPPNGTLNATEAEFVKKDGDWYVIKSPIGNTWVKPGVYENEIPTEYPNVFLVDGKKIVKVTSNSSLYYYIENKPVTSLPAGNYPLTRVHNSQWYVVEYNKKNYYIQPNVWVDPSINANGKWESAQVIYKEPTEGSAQVGTINGEEEVGIFGYNDEWVKVKKGDVTGWTKKDGYIETKTYADSNTKIELFFVIDQKGTQTFFETYTQAKAYYDRLTGDAEITNGIATIVSKKGTYVYITKSPYAEIYDEKGIKITYLQKGHDVDYVKTDGNKVWVYAQGVYGYFNKSDVEVKTSSADRSYYYKENGDLIHNLNTGGSFYKINVGKANVDMPNERFYTSDVTNVFTNSYPYLQFMPIRTGSEVTGAMLNAYIENNVPASYKTTSAIRGKGNDFVNAAKKENINPYFLLSLAIHESAWGTSKIAIDKNNYFGIGAVDSDPYNSATKYASPEDGIRGGAQFMQSYLQPSIFKYGGGMLGNKKAGMNVWYSSDPYWGEKAAARMYDIVKFVDKNYNIGEYNKFGIAKIPTGSSLFVYNNGRLEKTFTNIKDRYVAILSGRVNVEGKIGFQVTIDEPEYQGKQMFVQAQDANILPTN